MVDHSKKSFNFNVCIGHLFQPSQTTKVKPKSNLCVRAPFLAAAILHNGAKILAGNTFHATQSKMIYKQSNSVGSRHKKACLA